MAGWIKLHRKLLDNPVVCKDSDHLAIWIYLLLNATHDNYPAIFQGKKITLEPGQLLTGRKSISEKLNISESKVQRTLKNLKSEQQIEQQTGNKNRLITIVKWLEYQDSEQQIEQQVNNKRTTTEQQVNTNKNVKNVKNERMKEIYNDLPLEFEQPIKDFVEMRKTIKRPLTESALKLTLKKLNELSDGDSDISIKILNQSTMNCWQGLFPLKEEKNNKKNDPDFLTRIIKEGMENERNGNSEDNENNKITVQRLL